MSVISVAGFYDLHIHTSPAPFVRIGDSVDVARWCAAAGMAGIAIKSHFESTISKVHHAVRGIPEFPEFKVFAGIALNRGVGGINPGAVEIALDQGAKIVWLPTFDACNHARVFGGTGEYGFSSMRLGFKGSSRPHGNFSTLRDGKLTDDAKEVIDIIAAYDAVLATGHVSREEIFAVFEYARGHGVKRLVVTHPEFVVPNLDVDTMKVLAAEGAMMEFCAVNCFPMSPSTTLDRVRALIDEVGPAHIILSSDSGQPFNPKPPETLRTYVQCLHEKGVSEAAIAQMCIANPERLLGIEKAH
ncbi:MAG: DUF6282 family protein [Betaproteobacteria bacterium]